MLKFEHHDPFSYPENIVRVTAGHGGEALLIFGREKTVLYDCGMAYCHEKLVENIKKALMSGKRETLDMILVSHTHYDHIGALPYILREWPDAQVYGAAKAKSVFESEGARKTMKRLGEAARDSFSDSKEEITTEGIRLDKPVADGDCIDIGGGEYFRVLDSKGHTDCSLAYVLEPESVMFSTESTGVLEPTHYVSTAFLKSYEDTIDAARRCRAYKAKRVIVPHYGILPEGQEERFFDEYIKAAQDEKELVLRLYDQGLELPEIMDKFVEKFWDEERAKDQPLAAFLENAKYSIMHIIKVFR